MSMNIPNLLDYDEFLQSVSQPYPIRKHVMDKIVSNVINNVSLLKTHVNAPPRILQSSNDIVQILLF